MNQDKNKRENRKNAIKEMLKQLHLGKSVDEVKGLFSQTFDGVSAGEISAAEQELINEGMAVEEIQKLCDVHAAVFEGAVEEVEGPVDYTKVAGHPVNVLILENRFLQEIIGKKIRPFIVDGLAPTAIGALKAGLEALAEIDLHYSRKENIIFPYMEKYGITAPPQVMWAVDDEIRALIKAALHLIEGGASTEEIAAKSGEAADQVEEMIYKEESILIPMVLEVFNQTDWAEIVKDSAREGYLIDNVPPWQAATAPREEEATMSDCGKIVLPTGEFKLNELEQVLNHLPFDITFVDKDDIVKYFSQGKERIFVRTKSVIGRNVSNCHPPASVHVVEDIVADFKSGKKDHEDFWINMGDAYVYIRYFALRDQTGEFLGVVEVTQDIKPIQAITGEKRLIQE
ncbi:MAG: DUF438 domain-containing protein [Clostridiales bacterium]|nr:DUF438 domain-containing protein [Clostridiales bacterium]